jgi:hypothetical protein
MWTATQGRREALMQGMRDAPYTIPPHFKHLVEMCTFPEDARPDSAYLLKWWRGRCGGPLPDDSIDEADYDEGDYNEVD